MLPDLFDSACYDLIQAFAHHASESRLFDLAVFEGAGGLLCFVKDLGSTNKVHLLWPALH